MLARKEPVYNHIKISQKYLFECHEERLFVFFLAGTGIFGLGAAQKKELFSPIQL